MKWMIIVSLVLLASCSSSDDGGQPSGQDVDPVTNEPDSSPASDDDMSPVTETPTDVPTINRDTHDAILLDVFKVFTGESFSDRFNEIPVDVAQFGGVITQGVVDDFDPANSTPTVYSCENGGTVNVLTLELAFDESTNLDFTNCQVGSLILEGDYRIFTGGSEEFSDTDGHSSTDGLAIDFGSGSTMEFTGRYDNGCCTQRFSLISHSFSENFSLAIDNAGALLKITEANAEYTVGTAPFEQFRTATMTGGFNVLSPASSGSTLTANVLSDFNYQSAEGLTSEELGQLASTWTFTTGKLSVTAEDGSVVELDAESGDASTARITITNASGEETFDQPWSLWMDTLTSVERFRLRALLAYGN